MDMLSSLIIGDGDSDGNGNGDGDDDDIDIDALLIADGGILTPSNDDENKEEGFRISTQSDLQQLLKHINAANNPPMMKAPSLKAPTLEGIAELILSGRPRSIIIMCGSALSEAAGIIDYMSPDSVFCPDGTKHRVAHPSLERFNLADPHIIFDMKYFRNSPEAFYAFAAARLNEHAEQQMNIMPTYSHYFLRLLADKGLLRRIYTQNLDGLERKAGIAEDLIVAANGTYTTATCLDCHMKPSMEYVNDLISEGKVPRCLYCRGGLVKPDLVFYGEPLPERLINLWEGDFAVCDLLLILGTELGVQPFASFVNKVPHGVPRLLVSRSKHIAWFDDAGSNADISCDVRVCDGVDEAMYKLAKYLNWEDALTSLINSERDMISSGCNTSRSINSIDTLLNILMEPSYGLILEPEHEIDEILPGLWIGDKTAAHDSHHLRDLGICFVLNVAECAGRNSVHDTGASFYNIDDSDYLGLPLEDHCNFDLMPFLPQAIVFIHHALEAGINNSSDSLDNNTLKECVGSDSAKDLPLPPPRRIHGLLVHSYAGSSRSAAVVIAYLLQCLNMGLLEALRLVRRKREICPNDGFLKQLIELAHKTQLLF